MCRITRSCHSVQSGVDAEPVVVGELYKYVNFSMRRATRDDGLQMGDKRIDVKELIDIFIY